MEPITTLELDLEPDLDQQNAEELLVEKWCADQLQRLGLPRVFAEAFAGHVDWHEVAALVGRGCPPMPPLR